jgi:hypothetical protein
VHVIVICHKREEIRSLSGKTTAILNCQHGAARLVVDTPRDRPRSVALRYERVCCTSRIAGIVDARFAMPARTAHT